MIKKLSKIWILFIFLCFLPNVFSATQVISGCPETNLNNNTEYILADNFFVSANACFYFNSDLENVTINGNFTPITNTYSVFALFRDAIFEDITIKNMDYEGDEGDTFIDFDKNFNLTNFYAYNNSIKKVYDFIEVGEGKSSGGLGFTDFNGDFEISNSFVSTRAGFLTQVRTGSTSAGLVDYNDLEFENIDYVNYDPAGVITNNRGAFLNHNTNNGRMSIYGNFKLKNVNIVAKNGLGSFDYGFNLYGTYEYDNVFDGSLDSGSDVSLPFHVTDMTIFRTSDNGVVYSNQVEPTYSKCHSDFCPKDNMVFISQAWQSPTAYESNAWYVQSQPLTLNATFYHNFLNKLGVTLDLSSFPGENVLILKNTRTLRFDTSSTLYGGEDILDKPIIVTSGTALDTAWTGAIYNTNYQLIEFSNDLTIDNINFDLNVAQDYGIVRPTDSSDEGIFQMYNSEIDINHDMTEKEMPMFVVGTMTDIQNNNFEIGQQYNITMFAGGVSSGVSGGHKIKDNTFEGGGFIFNHLQESGTDLASKFIHNEFLKYGTFYSLPFDTQFGDTALLDSPSLNGTIVYKTACTNYLFNIGNYYKDLDEIYSFNDTDSDDVADNPYFRGKDINVEDIFDYRVLIDYPYDFTSNLGKAYDTFDVCGDFSFNVEAPTENTIYNSSYDVISKWSYESNTYDDLVCIENMNGQQNIINSVSSSEEITTDWDTSDGAFNYGLKCCDDLSCDNFVKQIDDIYFCVGDCDSVGTINDITTPAVYGCTDSSANNYNPSATTDDGSCVYDEEEEENGGGSINTGSVSGNINTDNLFSGDIDLTLDSMLNMFKQLNAPLMLLIFIGFVIVILAIFVLIFTLPWLLINNRK